MSIDEVLVSKSIQENEAWYLAITIDREAYTPVIILSKQGGSDMEAVPKQSTGQLHRFHFGISEGITLDTMSQISSVMGISSGEKGGLETVLNGLYKVFVEKDATLLEINSLARSADGSFTCADSTLTFDDAAAKRQQEVFALRDVHREVPEEVEAEKHGLVYVKMDGSIGNVVNGAGLAMATNDAIGLYGGASANFLDAGGQATKETMQQAFAIVMGDERVKTVLVNIYGGEHCYTSLSETKAKVCKGITNCTMIAESIIGAAAELGSMRVPVVVRLQGTNSAQGLKLVSRHLIILNIS